MALLESIISFFSTVETNFAEPKFFTFLAKIRLGSSC